MTNKDKKIVSDYMGWKKAILSDGYHNMLNNRPVVFDLNDAGLIVKEMVKRGDWEGFMTKVYGTCHFHKISSATVYLFNADNFFSAFVEWRKGNEQG